MRWHLSHRADPRALPLADAHYSRRRPGTSQFVPPGRCLVLLTEEADALWVTAWSLPECVDREWWPAAWTCSLFRNESDHLASDLIREAVAATRAKWGDPPADGMVTIINPRKVRHKRDPGRCFIRAGFTRFGTTRAGLIILRLSPDDMPAAAPPNGWQLALPLVA